MAKSASSSARDALCAVFCAFTDQIAETLRLVRRYHDTPMSFADAWLVRMAEQTEGAIVFTTDSDFRTYRKNGRQIIPLIMPDL